MVASGASSLVRFVCGASNVGCFVGFCVGNFVGVGGVSVGEFVGVFFTTALGPGWVIFLHIGPLRFKGDNCLH